MKIHVECASLAIEGKRRIMYGKAEGAEREPEMIDINDILKTLIGKRLLGRDFGSMLLESHYQPPSAFGIQLNVSEDEPLRLILFLDMVKEIPSGSFVFPLAKQQLENEVAICKEGEKIKIFRIQKRGQE
jgi:hypothetical protein